MSEQTNEVKENFKEVKKETSKQFLQKQVLLSVFVAAIFGAFVGCMYPCGRSKIAVIDLDAVVARSQKVQYMKNENNARLQELGAWLQAAQSTVDEEQDKKKQEALFNQYSAEFAQKQAEINTQYEQKLQSLSNEITETISENAKKKGYSLVITKNITVYGGKDITEEIAKIIE